MTPATTPISPLLALLLLLLCALVLATAFAVAIVSLRRVRRRSSGEHVANGAFASVPSATPAVAPEVPEPPAVAPGTQLPYTRVPALLTRAEQEFFAVLREAIPSGWHLFPQVRLANLINVERRARFNKTHFYRIQAKCVDFVLCEPHGLAPQLVIELDDSSHQLAHRQARDAFVDAALASAGLPILHIAYQRRYDRAALAQQIAAALAPAAQHAIAARPSAAVVREVPKVAFTLDQSQVRWACRQCNAMVGEHAKFCNSCGAPLAL